MQRTAMRRRTAQKRELAKASTLRARSRKQASKDRKRAPHKKVYLLQHPMCEARIEGVCTGRSQHVHEPWLRSAGGPTDEPLNYKALCFRCHAWAHTHPEQARGLGLLVRAADGARWLAARRAAA